METTLSPNETAVRLLAAAACGIALGITRDLKRKPTGMRTLALVSLGAALATVATVYLAPFEHEPNGLSRVVQGVLQGVLTGIAFLGAGAIIRIEKPGEHMPGLTTAANVFVTAAVGIACGLGQWWAAAIAVVIAVFVLVVLSPVERRLEELGRHEAKEDARRDQPPGGAS